MIVSVKLGVPSERPEDKVDLEEVGKVFPYGKLLPVEVVTGGVSYSSGRVVRELGDVDDTAYIVNAVVSVRYEDGGEGNVK